MSHASLAIVRREHRALSAKLRSITLLLDEHSRRRGTHPPRLRGAARHVVRGLIP